MITDGSHVCGLCGEWRTGCNLCLVAPLVDMTEINKKVWYEKFYAEQELKSQETAIRTAAEAKRRGFLKEEY